MEEGRMIEIVVAIRIREDADPQEVVSEMDYSFTHADILDTEIRDINTEL